METINDRRIFELEKTKYSNIINIDKKLPDQVFKDKYRSFIVMESDIPFMEDFYYKFNKYLESINEKSYNICVIDPDPEKFFYRIYKQYPMIKVNVHDTYKELLNIGHSYPGNNESSDPIITNSDILLFYSEEANWGIYFDIGLELAIMAFIDPVLKERFFDHIDDPFYLIDKEDLSTTYIFSNTLAKKYIDEIAKNYID